MFTRRLAVMTALSIALMSTVSAQQAPAVHMHGGMQASATDTRQPVQFPAEMQTSFLGNMRDHMQTINGIVQALAAGDYAAASRTAAERLGLDSPSAAGCKPKAANGVATGAAPVAMSTPAPGAAMQSMDEMMALYMPESMRAMGLSMHTAASDFASVAAKAAATRDSTAAMTALSRVTQNCVACHSTYRLR
jgi:hypothetical protein